MRRSLGLGSQRLLNSLAPSAGMQSPRNNANVTLCLRWDKMGKKKRLPAGVQTHLHSACHKTVKPINSVLMGRRREWGCRFPDSKPSQANGRKGGSCDKAGSLAVVRHPARRVQGAQGLCYLTCEGISPAHFPGSNQDQMTDMVKAWAFFVRVAEY